MCLARPERLPDRARRWRRRDLRPRAGRVHRAGRAPGRRRQRGPSSTRPRTARGWCPPSTRRRSSRRGRSPSTRPSRAAHCSSRLGSSSSSLRSSRGGRGGGAIPREARAVSRTKIWPKASTTVRCSSRSSRRSTPARRPLAVTSVASAPSSSTRPENTAFMVGGSTVTRPSPHLPDVPDQECARRDEGECGHHDERPCAPGGRRAERVELTADDDRRVADHGEEPRPLVPCRHEHRARAAHDRERQPGARERETYGIGDEDHDSQSDTSVHMANPFAVSQMPCTTLSNTPPGSSSTAPGSIG
jgi:hypothetical protein